MYRTVWPSVDQAFKDRRDNIEGKLEQAEQGARRPSSCWSSTGGGCGTPRTRPSGSWRRRANAERVRRELLAKAETDAGRELDRARQAIRAERDQAIRQLRNEVGTLAVELATRVVGDSLDRDRQLRLVDEYIDELGNQAQAGAMTSRRRRSRAVAGRWRRWRPRLTRRWPPTPSGCSTRRPAGASRPSTRSRPSSSSSPGCSSPRCGCARPWPTRAAARAEAGPAHRLGGPARRATVELLATAATRQRVRLRDFAAGRPGRHGRLHRRPGRPARPARGRAVRRPPWSSSSRRSARP